MLKGNELKKYLSSLEKRAESFKKKVLIEASSSFMEIVKDRANQQGQGYSEDIEQRVIAGSDDTVVMVDTKEVEIEKVNDAVFYYRPKLSGTRYSEILNILKEYEPFPKDLLPWKHDPREVKLVFRKVSKTEFEDVFSVLNIYNFLEKTLPEIRHKLITMGISPSQMLSQNEVDASTLVMEDLGFSVLRKELGIRSETIPVWKPAVQEFQKNGIDKKIMKEMMDVFDSDNDTFDKIESLDTIDPATVKDIDEFQKKLLG